MRPIGRFDRVRRDPDKGWIRTWFRFDPDRVAAPGFDPATVARELLRDKAPEFGWHPDLPDLQATATLKVGNTRSVRFRQRFKGVRVEPGEVVVNLFADGRLPSVHSNFLYDIPEELDPQRVAVPKHRASELVGGLLEGFGEPHLWPPELLVYRYPGRRRRPAGHGRAESHGSLPLALAGRLRAEAGEPAAGEYQLVWEVIATTERPNHAWRFIVSAMTGGVLDVIDLFRYANAPTSVFDPNPIITGGDTGLTTASPPASLDAQSFMRTLENLNPPQPGAPLTLSGANVEIQDFDAPVVPVPTGQFLFKYGDVSFLSTMVYYHIDRLQELIRTTLGLPQMAAAPTVADPQANLGLENSYFDTTKGRLAFGGGPVAAGGANPVPDASDAHVIVHEYGHALQDRAVPGFDNYESGLGEGFGDFLAAVWYDDAHKDPARTRGFLFGWNSQWGSVAGAGFRRHNNPDVNDPLWRFDGQAYKATYVDGYTRGSFWCATMFELYRKLGGDSAIPGVRQAARELAIRLHLSATAHLPSDDPVQDQVDGVTASRMAKAIEQEDGNVAGWKGYANGLHKKVIYDTFHRRGLLDFPSLPVDVYIDDGRQGGYGSPSGQDLFSESLWRDVHWDTKDIWVTTAPYVNAAAQQAGGPGDHVEPAVGQPAHVYARVRNRATTPSGPVTVRAFHCLPGIGMTWPAGWAAISDLSVPDVPSGGAGVVAGPFTWTPTQVGHECLLVVVECANDPANTEPGQGLTAGDKVGDWDLVPFDNNIAQRNLFPVSGTLGGRRSFFVWNPDAQEKEIELRIEQNLPEGWSYRTDPDGADQRSPRIVLAAGEAREVTLDLQPGREPQIDPENPPALHVIGILDGRVIGGVTYYLAPPSAFPGSEGS